MPTEPPAPLKPRLTDLESGFRYIGAGRTTGFALIREKAIEAVKVGAKTMLVVNSLDAYIARLPRVGADQASAQRSDRFRQLRAMRRDRPARVPQEAEPRVSAHATPDRIPQN